MMTRKVIYEMKHKYGILNFLEHANFLTFQVVLLMAHIAAAARAKVMSSLIPKLKLTGGMCFLCQALAVIYNEKFKATLYLVIEVMSEN